INDLQAAVSAIELMNSAKGAMVRDLENYIREPSDERWSVVLTGMRATSDQVAKARQAVVVYDASRSSNGSKIDIGPLDSLISDRAALLARSLKQPPPPRPDKSEAQTLLREHQKLVNDIQDKLAPILLKATGHQ